MLGIIESFIAAASQSAERMAQFTEYMIKKARLVKRRKIDWLKEKD